MHGIFVAIDPGTVRHGVAICDELGITSSPLGFISARPESNAIDAIIEILKGRKAVRLIVGLPINMDGSEGPMAKMARELAGKINAKFQIQTIFVDERLSSNEAESKLMGRGLTNKQRKRRVDALAAQIILADYLNSIRPDARDANSSQS